MSIDISKLSREDLIALATAAATKVKVDDEREANAKEPYLSQAVFDTLGKGASKEWGVIRPLIMALRAFQRTPEMKVETLRDLLTERTVPGLHGNSPTTRIAIKGGRKGVEVTVHLRKGGYRGSEVTFRSLTVTMPPEGPCEVADTTSEGSARAFIHGSVA